MEKLTIENKNKNNSLKLFFIVLGMNIAAIIIAGLLSYFSGIKIGDYR